MNWYLMVLKNYAKFDGRARRKEYWMFVLFNSIASILLSVIDGVIGLETFGLSTIYTIAVLVPTFAVGVRRMHDVGKSGWFLIIPIYSFILAVTDGETGANKYGVNPKNPTDELNEIGLTEA